MAHDDAARRRRVSYAPDVGCSRILPGRGGGVGHRSVAHPPRWEPPQIEHAGDDTDSENGRSRHNPENETRHAARTKADEDRQQGRRRMRLEPGATSREPTRPRRGREPGAQKIVSIDRVAMSMTRVGRIPK